jgi:uncharacterized membrane protein YbhN (UPF0104 family)
MTGRLIAAATIGSVGTHTATLPEQFAPRRLLRGALRVLVLLGVLVLIALFAPGLGDVRRELGDANLAWLGVGVAFEALSTASYVLLFRPVFCSRMPWRRAAEIGLAEVGVGSIVPASGAGGLALGAWILGRQGMPRDRIARRSVAFFLIKSSVNFIAVAVLGLLLWSGIVGPDQPAWLTLVPALMSLAVIWAVLLLPRLGRGRDAPPGAGQPRRLLVATRRAIVDGVRESVTILRGGDPLLVAGAVGYWAFDNAVLWATYHAVGDAPPVSVVLMGYLIGQLGGALPIPGGIGGIDLGLIGALAAYGAPLAETTAAVLLYRLILFWLPLLAGAVGFASLRRTESRRS